MTTVTSINNNLLSNETIVLGNGVVLLSGSYGLDNGNGSNTNLGGQNQYWLDSTDWGVLG